MSTIRDMGDYVIIGGVVLRKRASYRESLQFERRVGAIFKALGASIEYNVPLAGNQIDILVEETTASGGIVRSAVECKALSGPVGVDHIRIFVGIVSLLQQRGLIDRAILVSMSGFTSEAREAAKENKLELLEIADLEERVRGKEAEYADAIIEVEQAALAPTTATEKPTPKLAFVVMPFDSDLDDLYRFGISGAAEEAGVQAKRGDQLHHNKSIPEVIKDTIAACDVIIAEVSQHNPNVFYEVGMAHAMQKETILICKEQDMEKVPFDISVINHVVYKSIGDLREKLKARLIGTLGGGET